MKLKLLNFFTQAIGGLKEVSHGTLQGLMLKDCLPTPQCTLTHTLTHTHSHTHPRVTHIHLTCVRVVIYICNTFSCKHSPPPQSHFLSVSDTHTLCPPPCPMQSFEPRVTVFSGVAHSSQPSSEQRPKPHAGPGGRGTADVWLSFWFCLKGQPCGFPHCTGASLLWLVGSISRNQELHPGPPMATTLHPPPSGPASLSWFLFRLLPEFSLGSLGPGSTSWTWTGIRHRCSMMWTAPCPSTPAPTSPRMTTGWSGTQTASTSQTGEAPSAAGAMHRWVGMWGAPPRGHCHLLVG